MAKKYKQALLPEGLFCQCGTLKNGASRLCFGCQWEQERRRIKKYAYAAALRHASKTYHDRKDHATDAGLPSD